MKIRDIRCGWNVEGEHIATIPAHQAPTQEQLLDFYGLLPEDAKYAEHNTPMLYERRVLRTAKGMVIVPMNPKAYEAL